MMLGTSSLASAAAPPGTHLQIQDVSVNFTAQKILILGQQFNFGPGPLTVTLANVGNLTPDCTPNFAVTPQTITCDLSGGTPPFPGAGDYLLTVSNGTGTSQIDVYDLTIGAVGPVGATGPIGPVGASGPVGATGPQGPSGASGITGLEGMSCPSGQSVTGFDASGKIICSGAAAACTTHVFTFSMMSSPGGETTSADWPGLSVTMTDPADANCGVTVGEPSGNISVVGALGDARKNQFLNKSDRGNRIQKEIAGDHMTAEETGKLFRDAMIVALLLGYHHTLLDSRHTSSPPAVRV